MEKITRGRITYFEPNELFGGDNQPVNQEDLTKYVNLSVRIPSRFYNEGEIKKKYESILKGSVFVEKEGDIEYTKLYLTDNYVNVSYTEFGKNGEINNGELFGIESINISFDVQFFPIVTINFTDIKGFGLMSTMEYNYEKGKINNLTAKSFFTSLFNFPYPIFTLEVKGYYGKSMSFDLALKDFNTSFESSTGNFKTTVSFIGHLYGVYADIPMSYLLIAPYIDYKGKLDQDSNVECIGETWKRMSNPELLTYLGILNRYKELLKGENIESGNATTITQYEEWKKNTSLLKEIIELYDEIIMFAKKQAETMTITQDGCFATKNENEESLEKKKTGYKHPYFSSGVSFNIIYKTDKETLKDVCEPYKKLTDGITNGDYDEKYKLNTEEYGINMPSGCTDYSYTYFKDIFSKKEQYKNELINYENKLKNTSEDVLIEVNNIVTEKLGFKPTIKNIYKILFKHLECFGGQFYKTIKNIDSNRIKKENRGYYIEDIEGLIPPFPMVCEIENNERKIIYPGKCDLFKNYPEIKLVENIYESVKYFSNKLNDSIAELAQAETYSVENVVGYGPLFTDFKNTGKGNYFILTMSEFKPSTNEKMAEAIKDIFLARLNTYSKIHYIKKNAEYNEKYFNEKEAVLLYNSNPFLKRDVYNLLKRFLDNKDELYKRYGELRGGKTWGLTTFPPGSTDIDKIDDVYKHSNSELKNSLIIFEQGTKERCDTFINENFNSSFSFSFNKVEKIATHIEGWKVNKYVIDKSKASSYELKSTVAGNTGFNFTSYWDGEADGWLTLFYLNGGTVFYDKAYKSSEQNPFFTWFAEEYSYKADVGTTGKTRYSKKTVYKLKENDYEKSYSKRNQSNKCVSISLAHLLGAGEALYYGDDSGYFIPTTIIESLDDDVNWGSGVYFNFRKYFRNDTEFCKVIVGLYKTFFDINPNDKDKEYYNYFNIPEDIKTLADAYNYWFAIGKNFQYDNKNSKINEDELSKIFEKFLTKVGEMYNWNETIAEVKETTQKEKEVNDIKNNIYYTLKNLYEKWLSALPTNFFNMNKPDSEFKRVEFLTTTFNDISDNLIVDIESFVKQIVTIKTDSESSSKSVLSFMASTAQNNLCTFLILPTKIFNENLKDTFKPFSFFNGGINHDVYGSTYVVMYNSDVSHKLDIPGSETLQDGYMIADYIDGNLEITDECEKIMKIKNDNSYEISSFGVTYGMQNQNFFKNISVDTQAPQMTDYAIANTLVIAEHGNSLTSLDGSFVKPQSIYPVYANRSYNCSVEMMGCMNITPLMYFQLNNVPMFKGAYLITNVEHNITPNDFTTKFTGVRVSKYNIPLNKISMDMSRIGSIVATSERNNYGSEQNEGEQNGGGQNGGGHTSRVLKPVNMDTSKDIINLDPGGAYFIGYNGTCRTKPDCDNSARSTMRNLIKNTLKTDINTCGKDGGSSDRSIRLITEKKGDNFLYYFHSKNVNGEEVTMKQKYRETVEMIKYCLHKGYPVRVSGNHTFDKGINEGTSDHFVAIYAYGIIEKDNAYVPFEYTKDKIFNSFNRGKIEYFRFYESGSNTQSVGVNPKNVFIYVDDEKPLFFCPSDRKNRHFSVVNVFPYPDKIVPYATNILSFPLVNYLSGIYDDGKGVKVPLEKYEEISKKL